MTSGINIHDPWQTPGCDPCFKGRLLLTAHDQRARLMQFELNKEKAENRQNEAFLICLEILHVCHLTMLPLLPGLMQAADKALDALKRMCAGMAADRKVGRSKMKSEMTALFRPGNKRKSAKRSEWRHKFVCLAYRDQDRIPTTDADKEELFQAGLGEKEIHFDSLDIEQDEFKEILFSNFPRLKDGGGFQFLKGISNTHNLEVLSMAVHTSPNLLKQRVGNSRVYIRPVQHDLDLTPVQETPDGASSVYSLIPQCL